MKVGKLPFYELQKAVEKALIHDLMDNVRDWLAVLMDNYKVNTEHTDPLLQYHHFDPLVHQNTYILR